MGIEHVTYVPVSLAPTFLSHINVAGHQPALTEGLRLAGCLLQARGDPPSQRPCPGGMEGAANRAEERDTPPSTTLFKGTQSKVIDRWFTSQAKFL